MNLRLHLLSSSLVSFLVAAVASAAQDDGESGTPFDCYITSGDRKFDLTSLAGQHILTRKRESPPTTMIDTLTFNICEDLQPQDGVDDADQCPPHTRACLTKTNHKESQDDRITAVIPLGNSSSEAVKYTALPAPTKGLSLTFEGYSYPNPSNPGELIAQSFHLRLLCSPGLSDPTFVSYDGSQAEVEWSASPGCPMGDPDESDKPKDDEDVPGGGGNDGGSGESKKSVGSGTGYFFLLLLLALVAYFALGAYYNYSTYGATGADLIPHRDFWREVPYMLRDVVSHLCSTVRPRSASRTGYIAV